MNNLLNGESQLENTDDFDTIPKSQLLRYILHQPQALNIGEIVELLHYDQLTDTEDK